MFYHYYLFFRIFSYWFAKKQALARIYQTNQIFLNVFAVKESFEMSIYNKKHFLYCICSNLITSCTYLYYIYYKKYHVDLNMLQLTSSLLFNCFNILFLIYFKVICPKLLHDTVVWCNHDCTNTVGPTREHEFRYWFILETTIQLYITVNCSYIFLPYFKILFCTNITILWCYDNGSTRF